MSKIVIGTRGSPLALWQANYVCDTVASHSPDIQVELKVIKTSGEQSLRSDSTGALDKGLFTREIENELLAGSIDLAVHSLKDLPTELVGGLMVAAITVREDPADVVISKSGGGLDTLPAGAKVLTGSLRRRSQVLHKRPDLVVQPIRGNVQTRLRKLAESDADAMILARAGLVRLDLGESIAERLDPAEFLPACGQGALAIEIRQDDSRMCEILAPLNDPQTHLAVGAERSFLASLGGGCQVPVGAYGRFADEDDTLTITGMVASLDGRRLLRETITASVGDIASAEELGRSLGQELRRQGGGQILTEILERT